MKIVIIIVSLFFISCNDSGDSAFNLDPSKPVEVGIQSIQENSSGTQTIKIYMINHQPVRGVQFEIEPKGFFEVDSVFGGRCEANKFFLDNNKMGKIIGFSYTGSSIPESNSSKKEDNILFSITAKLIKPIDVPITMSSIIASSSAEKMDCLSIPFEIIGK